MTADRSDIERHPNEGSQPETAAGPAVNVPGLTLRAVVEASPLAIISRDLQGRVTSWNASAERLFGWRAEEVLGKPSPTMPNDSSEESNAMFRAVHSGRTVTGLYLRKARKDGSSIVASVSAAPLYDEAGAVTGSVVITEDVTQQQRAEHERNLLLARELAARSRAEDAAERISRLQRVSAALSEALTPDEVGTVILSHGTEALGASAAAISQFLPNENVLAIVAATGYPENMLLDFSRFPLDAPYPLARAVLTGEPIWIESPEQWQRQFPDLTSARRELSMQASASIPLLIKGRAFGALGLSFGKVRAFSDEDKTFALSLAQQCGQALERARLYAAEQSARQEAETARHRFEFLAQASITLSSSLDYSTTLGTVARLAVPDIADWCSVYIMDESDTPRLLAVAHIDPTKVELAHELSRRYPFDPEARTGVAEVLRTSQPELVPYIPDELLVQATPDPELLHTLRDLGLVSAMTVPLATRGRVLGAITFISSHPGRRFGEEDLVLASDLAGRAAVAVDNARLLRETQQGALEREAILGQIADGIVIADPSGTVVFSNTVAQSLLGTAGIGTPVGDQAQMFHAFRPNGEPFRSEELPLARASIGNETIANEDVVVHHPNGSQTIIECSATPVIGVDGTKMGGVVSFRDVTAQRTLERQKDDFLSAVAHDMKTPLTTIKGLAQILERRAARANLPETNSLRDGLRRIDATTTRMSAMINELLDVSRIQMGRPLDLIRAPADLVALMRHIVSEQQHTTEVHEISFRHEVGEVTGDWDAVRLERAFTNLVSNAITYSPRGGRIQVFVGIVDSSPSRAIVRIDDEGMGIPEQDLPHIFERFHRGSNVAGRIPGTGIGLAGAREIIRQHSGEITARARAEGGTTFEVILPFQPPEAPDSD